MEQSSSNARQIQCKGDVESNTHAMILSAAPRRFVLKLFSVRRRGRARSRLLGPNCSSEFRRYDVAIVEIFSPYKYSSVELRARWRCSRRIYDFLLNYKRVIKQASYDFKMLYPY